MQLLEMGANLILNEDEKEEIQKPFLPCTDLYLGID